MGIQKIKAFSVIGISVRTTNENGQAATDIPALWAKFMTEGILEKIPNRIDDTVYCMYSSYEKDHTRPYTTILGCKVEHLQDIPSGMLGKYIEAGSYEKFTATGNLMEGAVYNEWLNIWNAGISRTFSTDFEVYDEKARDRENAAVDIFIAVQ
jgi:predicted transcriptional regulator YdeE